MTARIFPPRCAHLVVLTNFIGLFFPLSAVAHVGLDSPNGGETLTAGSTFQIEWNPTAPHDTINWDLWYSTQGNRILSGLLDDV